MSPAASLARPPLTLRQDQGLVTIRFGCDAHTDEILAWLKAFPGAGVRVEVPSAAPAAHSLQVRLQSLGCTVVRCR